MSEFGKLRRPKKGETEEDLFEQMKQFESTKASIQPENIVKFPNKSDKKTNSKTSKFAAERNLKRQHENEEQKSSISFILKSVVEEKVADFSNSEKSSNFEQKLQHEQPFPEVLKFDAKFLENRNSGDSKSAKKKSLFAQKMASKLPPIAGHSNFEIELIKFEMFESVRYVIDKNLTWK